MRLFDGLLKKNKLAALGAPMNGECVSIKDVPDPTFAEEMLGKGIAVIPSDGKVYAPADGTISTVFGTRHAVGITTDAGAELLIHVGLDTVELKGEPFVVKVEEGQKVKKGDMLLEADLEQIKAAGKNTITPLVVCNSDEYSKVEVITGKTVTAGDDVMKLGK